MAKSKFDIVFLPRADDDLDEIITFIDNESRNAALKLMELIESKINQLADFPYLGKEALDIDIKRLGYRLVPAGNYLIFYRIENDEILICRVLHASRDIVSIFKK